MGPGVAWVSQYKIVFSGPVGAGKTTAIGTVSDVPPVATDVRASDGVARLKDSTTVAMDYGVLDLDSGERVHLFGTPGQERFDFVWEILSQGAHGLLLLVTNTRPDPLGDLGFFLDAFDPLIRSTRLVVGVTGMDLRAGPCLAEHRQVLLERGLPHPVLGVDARRREDVSTLIRALVLSDDPHPLASQVAAG
jgi:signal recognition particle receptor subunit beta